MALDFPASPTDGQTYQGYTYSSSIGAWQAKPAAQSPFFTGATPPANPVAGDSWFNTNDGTMYVYYYDGNTYQWVEHRSQIAKNQVGLVPIVPTSVAVGSGTASVASDGTITFTGTSGTYINGAFTSGFRNYRVIMTRVTGSAATLLYFRVRAAGSDKSTAVYYTPAIYSNTATASTGTYNGFNGITFTELCPITTETGWSNVVMDFLQPAVSDTHTVATFTGTGYSSGVQTRTGSVMYNVVESIDGFSIWPSTGGYTINGIIKIYGYN